MHDRQSVHDHCMTIIKDLEELEKLGLNIQRKLKINLILQFLISLFGQFIINYYMNKLDYNLSELVNMLVTTEGTLKSSKDSILAVERAPFKQKSQGKKKNKPVKKQKKKSKPKKDTSKKAMEKEKCFYCNSNDH